MKRQYFSLVILLAAVSALGLTCQLPARTHSILPPTNEKDLCRDDKRFFYSPTFDLCFPYSANREWQNVITTAPVTVPGTDLSVVNFFHMDLKQQHLVFSLYITGLSAPDQKFFQQEGLLTVKTTDPYLIGYKLSENLDPNVKILKNEVPDMLRRLQVFVPKNP